MNVRPSLIAATAVLAMAALAACGGSSATSSSETAGSSPGTAASGAPAGGPTDFAAFRSCLEDNGVTLPDMGGAPPSGAPAAGGVAPSGAPGAPPSGMPSGGPGAGGFPGGLPDGVDKATYDAAMKACADLAPQRGAGGPGMNVDQSALVAFKSCLTDNGVKVPEGNDWMRTLDRKDAKVSAAMKKCSPLLPAGGPGAGSSANATGTPASPAA